MCVLVSTDKTVTAVGGVALANRPHKDLQEKEKRGEGIVTRVIPRREAAKAPRPGPTHGR